MFFVAIIFFFLGYLTGGKLEKRKITKAVKRINEQVYTMQIKFNKRKDDI